MIDSVGSSTDLASIRRFISQRSFACIDLKNEQCLDNFIEFVQTLEHNQEMLQMVKKLLGGYGIVIMVYLKNFYDQMSAQFIEKYEKQLKIIAFYAKEMCNKEQIPELQFFFRSGIAQKQIYTNIRDNERNFINKAQIISKYYGQAVIQNQQETLFTKKMPQFLKQYQNQQFEKRALLKFQQLSKKLNKKDQTTSQSVCQLKQTSRPSSNDGLEEESDSSDSSDSFFQNITKNPKRQEKIQKIEVMLKNQKQLDQSATDRKEENKEKSYIIDSSMDSSFPLNSEIDETIQQTIQTPEPQQKFYGKKIDKKLQQEKQEKFNNIKSTNKANSLCCRKFFYEGDNIPYTDDTRIAMVNLTYPYKNTETFQLKNIICSFLNTEGGILYIGIEKNAFGKRTIKGGEYSESKKETILKSFRQMAQTIEPDIITHKMYNVYFVPVKQNYAPFSYIPGRFVIKCEVRYGIRDQVYSFNDGMADRFVFRNQGEIFIKQGRMLLKTYKQRILNPLAVPEPAHEGSCDKPQIGQQTHAYQPQAPYKNNGDYRNDNHHNPPKLRFTDRLPKTNNIITKQIKETQPFLHKQLATYSQQFSIPKKQPLTCYFFVVGINESQLVPILQKKNLNQFVKIESTKSKKIIVKVIDDDYHQKIHKILKKLADKYKEIDLYKMSLELKVFSPQQAYQVLQKKTEKFIIKDNIFRYQFYKDSLEGFILLQDAKLKVQFSS